MKLRCRQIFAGGGFTVAAWMGHKGDSRPWIVPEAVTRKDFASSSIICRGAFGYPREHAIVARAGDIVNAVMPDFTPGEHHWTALEDNSMELCATTSDAAGELVRADFRWEAVTGDVQVAHAVVIVATGVVRVAGRELNAPYILHVTDPALLQLTGRGMILRRL